jgi:hypothetical protein
MTKEKKEKDEKKKVVKPEVVTKDQRPKDPPGTKP